MRLEGQIVKRGLIGLGAAASALLLLASCGGGGGGTTTPGDNNGPLTIKLAAGTPTSGGSPLRVTFTSNISGGVGPYFYAWDYDAQDTDADGTIEPSELVFDRYLNNQFDKTISVTNDYFLNAASGSTTGYKAVLRVTDSEGTVQYASPIDVLVSSDTGFKIDPLGTVIISNELDDNGAYVFRNGQPVFFRSAVLGGKAPFTYQWDFTSDGSIDSTVQSPQYTYSNPVPGVRIFVAHLIVTDSNNDKVLYDFIVPVNGPDNGAPPPPSFSVVLGSDPAEVGGAITLRYDPTGADPNLPLQPELDLSIVVDPDPAKRGVPPYEYYWDFESDGAFDSQAPSPSIPYFKPGAVVASNPYVIQEDDKFFKLSVSVIDSAGQLQHVEKTVHVIKSTSRPVDPITVDSSYSVDGSGKPFGEVNGDNDKSVVVFNFTLPTLANATKVYEWKMDIDGDGTADSIGNPPSDQFVQLSSNTATATITFGQFDNDSNPGTPDAADWPVPGYYAVNATFRRLASAGGQQEDQVTVQVPVSIVERNTIALDGDLDSRSEHAMVPFWRTVAQGPNGKMVDTRGVVIIGGQNNGTALTSVQRVTQTFTMAPGAPVGQREAPTGDAIVSNGVSMNVPRRGVAATVIPTNGDDFLNGGAYFAMGGSNSENGVVASTELQPCNDNGGTIGWQLGPELSSPSAYPLTDALASPFGLSSGGEFFTFVCGGLHKATPLSTANVSAATIVYGARATPTDPQEGGNADATGNANADMITPRYDGTLALVASNGNIEFYAIGGRTAGGQSVGTVEKLDINTGLWTPLASLHDARSGCSAQVIDGKIYVYGGAYYPDSEAEKTLVLTAEVFNPDKGIWSYTLPTASVTDNGATASLVGPGAVSTADGTNQNTIWYFGGASQGDGDTDFLQEFVYKYWFGPTA